MHQLKYQLSMFPLLVAALAGCSDPEEPHVIYLAYDVLPSPGVSPQFEAIDTSAAAYEDELAFAQEIDDEVTADAFRKLRFHFDVLDHEISPGGDLLNTSPSMYTRVAVLGDETRLLGAALGFAMFQSSVLIIDFDSEERITGYVMIQFNPGELNPTLAQRFFVHAASVDDGLGVQYFSSGDTMLFVNLRLRDGTPYSRLGDHDFSNAFYQAASTFRDAEVTVSKSGHAYTELVENNWDSFPDGKTYLLALTSAGLEENDFERMQSRYNRIILESAARYGWEEPEPLPGPRPGQGAEPAVYQPRWYSQPLQGGANQP